MKITPPYVILTSSFSLYFTLNLVLLMGYTWQHFKSKKFDWEKKKKKGFAQTLKIFGLSGVCIM